MTKVVHLCSNTGGGAGRAAVRAHIAARRSGFESSILCLRDPSKVAGTITLQSIDPPAGDVERYNQFKKRFFDVNRTSISSTVFHPGFVGHDVSELEVIQESDLIHLHWINDFLRPQDVGSLAKLGKPMIWTLHDYWPITGGCHFPAGCEGFKSDCSYCHQLKSAFDLPVLLLADKLKGYGTADIHMTAPSRFMVDEIAESALFRAGSYSVLPNAVDTDVFSPVSNEKRMSLRSELSIGENDLVLMISAQSLREKRKGAVTFLNALRAVSRRPNSEESRRLVVVSTGHHDLSLDAIGVRFIKFPHVDDDHVLADVMRLSDFIVHPAQEETFGLGVMEAMACGTPAVIFENGGSLDFVFDGENGVVLRPNQDVKALADWIDAARAGRVAVSAFRSAARSTAEQFSIDRLAEEIEQLYEKLAPSQKKRARRSKQASLSLSLGDRSGKGAASESVSALVAVRRDDYVVRKTIKPSEALLSEPAPPEFARSLGANVEKINVRNSTLHQFWVKQRVCYSVEDTGVCGQGWHWLEKVSGVQARWMSRTGRVEIPGPIETPATLTIHGLAHAGSDILGSLTVAHEGHMLAGQLTRIDKRAWKYEVTIDHQPGDSGNLNIELNVQRTKQPDKDPRQLSVLVASFDLLY